MTRKIFRSILLVSAAVLLASLCIIMGCLYDYFAQTQERQLKDELRLAAYAVEEQVLEREFHAFKAESIDYGVMEKAKNIYILSGAFGWDDVGSWLAVSRIKRSNELGNVVDGNVVTVDTRNTTIQGGGKLIAAVGLEDMIVVDSEDALLICEKDHAGDIKKVLENLKICNRTEYL